MVAIREEKTVVGPKDFEKALKIIGPRIRKQDIQRMKEFKDEIGDRMYG